MKTNRDDLNLREESLAAAMTAMLIEGVVVVLVVASLVVWAKIGEHYIELQRAVQIEARR